MHHAGLRVRPPGFQLTQIGSAGGTVWQGVIPNRQLPGATRPSLVYLPPRVTASGRYPVIYLLHGLPGSPYSFRDGLRFAQTADALVIRRVIPSFIAVMPAAGLTVRFRGEWTGPWERYVLGDVVPWVDRHLPTRATAASRTLAGLSSGGYGAVDIGLRSPAVFRTLEAWSGYFRPFRDGSLAHASAAQLAHHNPTLVVRRVAGKLQRLGTRIFLSVGATHDRVTASWARSFARELARLRVQHKLWLGVGGHNARLWRAQLPAALRYALARRP